MRIPIRDDSKESDDTASTGTDGHWTPYTPPRSGYSNDDGQPSVLVWTPEVEPRQTEEAKPPPLRWKRSLALFLATCFTTFAVGGPLYAFAVMFTLTFHEFGHYLQARRYRMAASLPYFIPLPLPPFGTMGAVIIMPSRISNVRALFDMAISGPLAGLVPALGFTIIGLHLSEFRALSTITDPTVSLGSPLLFDWLAYLIHGPTPEGYDLFLHPLAFAGWVGIFITALNLIPISQLDGGHILYALLKKRSYPIAVGLFSLAIAATILSGNWGWSLMILLIFIAGPMHPPTANDQVPLGKFRYVLGWATLLFFIIGFTPNPVSITFPNG